NKYKILVNELRIMNYEQGEYDAVS
ncbi:hypothetical protein LCGC14_1555420, partial [marine sediment metagenome]